MKASQIINELKKHEKLLNEDLSDEELENLIKFAKSIKNEDLRKFSTDEIKQLNELVTNIVNKVKLLQTNILKNIEKAEKNTDATRAYLKNEILNDR